MRKLVPLFLLFIFNTTVFADIRNNQYTKLANVQPTGSEDKIEVVELFWYGCSHCYHFEPILDKWVENKPDDVEFVRVPAILGPSWELMARGYYTAEVLEVTDKIHGPLFDYIHRDRKRIRNVDDLRDFFGKAGISAEDFDKAFNSFAVVTMTNRAKQAHTRYGANGVPTVIVNGKYRTSAQQAGGNEKIIEVVDYLVEQERAAMPAAVAE